MQLAPIIVEQIETRLVYARPCAYIRTKQVRQPQSNLRLPMLSPKSPIYHPARPSSLNWARILISPLLSSYFTILQLFSILIKVEGQSAGLLLLTLPGQVRVIMIICWLAKPWLFERDHTIVTILYSQLLYKEDNFSFQCWRKW